MGKIYRLISDIAFEDKLCYSKFSKTAVDVCRKDPSHAMKSHLPKPLKVIGMPLPLTDIEWTVYSDIIVSERVARDLLAQKFSGFDLDPVDFYTTTETPFGRDSLELRVTGWGGQAPPRSGITIREQCKYCGWAIYNGWERAEEIFDIDQWDGSDFFRIWPMPRYIFVTEEVARFFQNADYSGVRLCELKDLKKSISGGFTPGHIEDWYDTDKAAEILRKK